MNKTKKNESIEVLKTKFSRYRNFYFTDSSSMTVAQVNKLRRVCFDRQVEMKVAKNTLIRKALETFSGDTYAGVFDALQGQTAILFSENAKTPALIISDFRRDSGAERPMLKAAFIDTEVYLGDRSLGLLGRLRSKSELVGEIIGMLQSPAIRVIGSLQAGGQKLAGILQTLEQRPAD
ncbi:MAG TPA: 50S ribosomal protein L10 [Chitinophagaceae bacterium]|nr:50S ribosomal protein L10 [Chitinophagaceae bacterium]